MPPELIVLAGAEVVVVVVAVTAIGGLRMWLNRTARAAVPQADRTEIRDGHARLEQAVDAIALEVERVSEGQRFTTKLLAERARDLAPLPPAVRER